MAFTDEELIEAHADRIAEIIQAQTRCSEQAKGDLRLALAEFAEEIKRQVLEP